MVDLRNVLKWDSTLFIWALLLVAVLLTACGAAPTPFEGSPYPDGPIAQMKQRCIDAGDVWEEDRLQCRAVAPWRKPR